MQLKLCLPMNEEEVLLCVHMRVCVCMCVCVCVCVYVHT